MVSATETPLYGGRVTHGVVRIGDTVRRPISADRSFVHELLLYLERKRFAGTPRFCGVDERGREILSYLPGDVPPDLGHFTDEQLLVAAGLLRRFHDATIDFPPVAEAGEEVVCHNDWSPPNAVFDGDLPYAMIDFDAAAPGARLRDLGYSAFTWLDLGNSDYSGAEQIRRLSVFADGYGLQSCSPASIAAHALERQKELTRSGKEQGRLDMANWAEAAANWTVVNVTERLVPSRSA